MTMRRNPFSRKRSVLATVPEDEVPQEKFNDPKDGIVLCAGETDAQRRAVSKAGDKVVKEGPRLVCATENFPHIDQMGGDFSFEGDPEDLLHIWRTFRPRHLVLPEDGGLWSDVGRRLAMEAQATIATRVVGLEDNKLISATNLLGQECVQEMAQVILVDTRFQGQMPKARKPTVLNLHIEGKPELFQNLRRGDERNGDAAQLALEEARFVISAGAGIRDLELFDRFVSALGATPGASRVLVDAGLMPRNRQIGVSGHTTQAELYVALGVSGAIQHLEGISGCQTVISVNTDRRCAMTARADITFVTDAEELMRGVLDRLEGSS